MSSVSVNEISPVTTGLFGKLPSHGDFIQRNIPYEFIERIDPWLQQYINISQQTLGDAWLDIYLTSPIWRFVFSVGIVSNSSWAGIMIPSVDRVGRYFPLVIASNLPWNLNPLDYFFNNTEWFNQIEEFALKTLEGQISADTLVSEIENLSKYCSSEYTPMYRHEKVNSYLFSNSSDEAEVALPYLFDSILMNQLTNYSVWSTSGSKLIDPTSFISQSLPAANKICSMLDGSWDEKGWYSAWARATKNEC